MKIENKLKRSFSYVLICLIAIVSLNAGFKDNNWEKAFYFMFFPIIILFSIKKVKDTFWQ